MSLTSEQDRRFSSLMANAQGGEKTDYNLLLREIASLLRGYFGSRAGSNEVAEDLVQETLVSIHRARHTYRSDRPFAPWMYAIARCRLADHWRKQSRRVPQVAMDDNPALDGLMEEEPVENALSERIQSTLDGLPDGQRAIVKFLKIEGLSIKEVARKMEMSEGAVKVAAHRAYEKLRRQLNNGEQNGN